MQFANNPKLCSWHAIRPEMRKPLGFARQRFGDESRDRSEISRLRKSNQALRFFFHESQGLALYQPVGALAERGYCMMIGGEPSVVERLDPIFATLAPGIGNIPRTSDREKLLKAACLPA
jgi:hypothetical protein